jgi:hypothetical protein
MIASISDPKRLEDAMNKSAFAIATVISAVLATLASNAEAHGFGMHHCGGFGIPIFNSYSSDSGYYSHRTYNYSHEARRPVSETVHVAKKSSETNVAKADTDDRVVSENSSIAVSSSDVAEAKTTATPVKTATVETANLGCKEFFPSVGMTLSVPCQ